MHFVFNSEMFPKVVAVPEDLGATELKGKIINLSTSFFSFYLALVILVRCKAVLVFSEIFKGCQCVNLKKDLKKRTTHHRSYLLYMED